MFPFPSNQDQAAITDRFLRIAQERETILLMKPRETTSQDDPFFLAERERERDTRRWATLIIHASFLTFLLLFLSWTILIFLFPFRIINVLACFLLCHTRVCQDRLVTTGSRTILPLARRLDHATRETDQDVRRITKGQCSYYYRLYRHTLVHMHINIHINIYIQMQA